MYFYKDLNYFLRIFILQASFWVQKVNGKSEMQKNICFLEEFFGYTKPVLITQKLIYSFTYDCL